MELNFEAGAKVVAADGRRLGTLENLAGDVLLVHSLKSGEQLSLPTSLIVQERSSPNSITLDISEEQIMQAKRGINASEPAPRVYYEIASRGYLIPDNYSCDMCSAKFKDSESLNKHRLDAHKGPVNI